MNSSMLTQIHEHEHPHKHTAHGKTHTLTNRHTQTYNVYKHTLNFEFVLMNIGSTGQNLRYIVIDRGY